MTFYDEAKKMYLKALEAKHNEAIQREIASDGLTIEDLVEEIYEVENAIGYTIVADGEPMTLGDYLVDVVVYNRSYEVVELED